MSIRCIGCTNQMFHYTRYITPKRVTSLRGWFISASFRPGNTITLSEEIIQQWRAVAYAEFSIDGGGGRKFENNEDQKKNFSTQNQSVFLPKITGR